MTDPRVLPPASASKHENIVVLVVDDEPETAASHAKYVNRVPGFTTGAIAANGQEALSLLSRARNTGTPFDLVLLDMTLPDLHGIDVAKRMRGLGLTTDIIAITAVRDLAVVRSAVATGITQYLIKPFTFAAFSEKLENHRQFIATMRSTGPDTSQAALDTAFSALRSSTASASLPKGLIPETLAQITEHLASQPERCLSATELGEELGISRVTARRYLEHLFESKAVLKQPRHGTRGRPEYEYQAAPRS
ncbi:response regulator [Glutamicibacter mishrai]|uniref:Transcriptional regulatory protein n=1 Tax=Glutamicibacter mishrai TaxID=1775880 RepID=A0A6H0SNE3_9MICC|nr:response regulator [Glutamicibacter mishrai]QIV88111.1 response regulator [Glutamicibacter mishrai]UTT40870.1 response regulator [Glutamicibacter mishrai]